MSKLIDGINHLKAIKAGIVNALVVRGAEGATASMKLADTVSAIENLASEGGDKAFQVWGDRYVYGYTGNAQQYVRLPDGYFNVSGFGFQGNGSVAYNGYMTANDGGYGVVSLPKSGSGTAVAVQLWHDPNAYYVYWW